MARIEKCICDRCKREIAPRFSRDLRITTVRLWMARSYRDYDLCADCRAALFRFMEGAYVNETAEGEAPVRE